MQELIRAIDLALAGDWDQAHKIVQNIENEMAYWIHAVLHKIEGDRSNSMYWYSRADKPDHFQKNATEELQAIRRELGGGNDHHGVFAPKGPQQTSPGQRPG